MIDVPVDLASLRIAAMKPLICVPMGDPAGIGPEILAAASLDPIVTSSARLLGVGNIEVLTRAAQFMRVNPTIHTVDESLSDVRENVLNFLSLDNITLDDFEIGKESAACGKAAFEFVAKAATLALKNKVDAVATTCINKKSLHLANVPYVGHTEILAGLSQTKDPLTMFQVKNLRVFFFTRHLSLMDACKAVKKEALSSFLLRCATALQSLGITNPKLCVAGLNPHCSDDGLFGAEEKEEISPAIRAAQEAGCCVTGPFPADSIFHFALTSNNYDAVISLYHDQGHIATKMIDFERTISITLGLPFLRTSVDHGTAFDIAGKGLASPVSLVEAIRLAALYAPSFLALKR